MKNIKIKRVLLTVTDKSEIIPLAQAFQKSGAELVATGKTAEILKEAGLPIIPIEEISGSPEAFQGRMKTLSFPVCSGILFRRGDSIDESDLKKLNIKPIDAVVCNFYPFDQKLQKEGFPKSPEEARTWVDLIDIGGPTLVRAAAKNAPHVLVLTNKNQYAEIIHELSTFGALQSETVWSCAAQAWSMVSKYDQAIASVLGEDPIKELRYGENPHQKAWLHVQPNSPVNWLLENFQLPSTKYEKQELSYNNILDCAHGYELMVELVQRFPKHQSCIILKHNNPCGVAMVLASDSKISEEEAQKKALLLAWEGDPISAFGGVVLFSHALKKESAVLLSERFIEVLAYPQMESTTEELKIMYEKRKKLKVLPIRHYVKMESQTMSLTLPGAVISQTADEIESKEVFKCVTEKKFPEELMDGVMFGICITRTLKSNALSLVRKLKNENTYQLVGTGQGQPNRVEALMSLAIPRAQRVLKESGTPMSEVILVSDAFFPFRDTVDAATAAGIRYIVQPGGSIKDAESIQACLESQTAMIFTGTRHFKH